MEREGKSFYSGSSLFITLIFILISMSYSHNSQVFCHCSSGLIAHVSGSLVTDPGMDTSSSRKEPSNKLKPKVI